MTTINEVKSIDSASFFIKKVVEREKKGETQLGREKFRLKRECGRFFENGLKAGDLPPKMGELECLDNFKWGKFLLYCSKAKSSSFSNLKKV